MGSVRRIGLASALALALLIGMSSPAMASSHEQANPIAVQQVPLVPAINFGWTWWPWGIYAEFNYSETVGIVQAGVAGAASFAASKIPSSYGKAVAAALGVGLFLTARAAVPQHRCVGIIANVLDQRLITLGC